MSLSLVLFSFPLDSSRTVDVDEASDEGTKKCPGFKFCLAATYLYDTTYGHNPKQSLDLGLVV